MKSAMLPLSDAPSDIKMLLDAVERQRPMNRAYSHADQNASPGPSTDLPRPRCSDLCSGVQTQASPSFEDIFKEGWNILVRIEHIIKHALPQISRQSVIEELEGCVTLAFCRCRSLFNDLCSLKKLVVPRLCIAVCGGAFKPDISTNYLNNLREVTGTGKSSLINATLDGEFFLRLEERNTYNQLDTIVSTSGMEGAYHWIRANFMDTNICCA